MFRHIKIMECWKRRCVTRTPHCAHGSSSTPARLTAFTYGAYILSALDDELWLSGGQMWLVPAQVHCTRRFACHALVPSTISMINLQSAKVPPQRHFWLEYANWMGLLSEDISLLLFFRYSFMYCLFSQNSIIFTRTHTCHSSVIITKYE